MIQWKKCNTNAYCFLSGADFVTSQEVGLCTINNDVVALALTVGKNTTPHQHGRPNEDSVGAVYAKENNMFLGVVADSHFGGLISDAVVQRDLFLHF